MKKEKLMIALCLLATFALWTALVCFVDVQTIGPEDSTVGFATANAFFHSLTGVHMGLYTLTDWLSLVPVGFIVGFAALGLVQWFQRKQLRQVDHRILVLGCFYFVVFGVYLLFEELVINYRPVFIEGVLEASYPSSTTMLVLCVMPTAIMQLHGRIKNKVLRDGITGIIAAFTAFMVIGRLISGVHWLTDIIGGILLSASLVMLYTYFSHRK